MKLKNPFDIISPENLRPEEIKSLFVKSYTELNILKNNKHTLIYGSRGNGKSMLLRFLEPKCQMLDLGISTKKFLESYNSFVGIYIPFKEGYFNKSDLQLIDKQIAYTLSKHLINLHIIGCFIDIISTQLDDLLSLTMRRKAVKSILDLLDHKRLHRLKKNDFKEVKEILLLENKMISDYLSKCNFPNFSENYKGNLSDYSTFIKPFFQEIQDIVPFFRDIPFYLLFDEGDRLYNFQKKYINTMVANRDHKHLSIKLASKIGGYDYYYTDSKTRIQEIHDYDTIMLDELYTHSKDTYFNKIKEIANRRLKRHGFKTNIQNFLPESESERKILKRIKEKTAEEWEQMAPKNRPELKNNYVNKYATARLFQYLTKRKTKKRYSGFNNIVHFSSGIVRNFLHPCYKMFGRAEERDHDFRNNKFIPAPIQNNTIYKYSDDFFGELDEAIKGLGQNSLDLRSRITNLKRLINSLGELFYKKLTDENSRDPRIISFALKNEPDDELRQILDYGVKESFFHKVYTVSKAGGGRLECFVLNRALCPAFKLDLSSLRGRILISSEELWGLIRTPKKTIKDIQQSKSKKTDLQKELFVNSIDEDYG